MRLSIITLLILTIVLTGIVYSSPNYKQGYDKRNVIYDLLTVYMPKVAPNSESLKVTPYFDGRGGELSAIVIDMDKVSGSAYDSETNCTVFKFKIEKL